MKKQESPKVAAKKSAIDQPKSPAVMQKYRTVGLKTGIPAGILIGLTKDQFSSRKHALSVVEDGIYLTKSAIEFMNGEIIGLYEVVMGMVANLESVVE